MFQPLAPNRKQPGEMQESIWRQKVRSLRFLWLSNTDEKVHHILEQLAIHTHKLRKSEIHFLIKNQFFQEARNYLESFCSLSDNDQSEAQYLLAQCYLGQGLITEAQQSIMSALKLEPEKADYWDILADCYLEQGEWKKATEALDKSLRSNPLRPETLYHLGCIYEHNQEYLEALRCFQGCCRLRPHNAQYWEMKAETHIHLGHIKQACYSFEKALKFSVDLDLATRLAYCYIQLNNSKKGIRYYETVLKHEPDHYDALTNLAAVFQNQGRSLEALNLLERAHKIYQNDPILLNNLAYTLVHLGRTRKAMDYYQAALNFAPEHPVILYNLSVCLVHRGNWEEAINLLNILLKIDPENSEAWALLGNVYEQITQYDIAIDCFNQSLKLA